MIQDLTINFYKSEWIVVYQGMQDPWAPKESQQGISLTLFYLAGSSAVKKLGNGISYPVLCLPSVSTKCLNYLKRIRLNTKQDMMERPSWKYGKVQEMNEAC